MKTIIFFLLYIAVVWFIICFAAVCTKYDKDDYDV